MPIRYRIQPFILLFVCSAFILQVASAQNVDALKSDIYSKLKCCACQVSFDRCTCPEAKEIKAYIDALLESGIGKEDIFYKVAKKFSLNVILDKQTKEEAENRLIKEAGEKRPQITLDSTSFDFGQVTKKQGKISKVFRLTNKGNAPLIIKNLKTSCPCASVVLKIDRNKSPYFGTEGSPKDWQAEIRPGESAELELVVDLGSSLIKPGKVIRDATIISNDPVHPDVSVRLEAEVVK